MGRKSPDFAEICLPFSIKAFHFPDQFYLLVSIYLCTVRKLNKWRSELSTAVYNITLSVQMNDPAWRSLRKEWIFFFRKLLDHEIYLLILQFFSFKSLRSLQNWNIQSITWSFFVLFCFLSLNIYKKNKEGAKTLEQVAQGGWLYSLFRRDNQNLNGHSHEQPWCW